MSIPGEALGSLLSFAFLIFLLSIPLFLLLIHIIRGKVLKKKNFDKKFKTIFEEFNLERKGASLYYFIFVSRRTFLVLALFLC